MKKTLLGTTALVSAGLVAGPALASDPLTVSVSGSVVTGFYFVDMDTVIGIDADDTKVAVVARNVDIVASGTLDNGLVAGAVLKLQLGDDDNAVAAPDDATFSEVYTFLEGGFGRLELGATDGAAFKMHYTSPWFVPGNGVDSPNIYNMNNAGTAFSSRTSTFSLLTEDTNKISYFTPRLAGFQLGASFTPDAGTAARPDPVSNGFGLSPKISSIEEVYEIALNYAGEFGGMSVGADVFYVEGGSPIPAADADPTEQGVGLNLGWGGFTLGGAYTQIEDIGGTTQNTVVVGNEIDIWTVGLAYGAGPWTVGVAYLESETENPAIALPRENSFLQIGGGYSLGAGVDVGLDIQFIEDRNPLNIVTTTVESTSAGVLLAISF